MKREYILGVDVGTSSVKAGIFDLDGGLLHLARSAHRYVVDGKCVDIDPEELFKSFLRALKGLEEHLPHVVAMGFSVLCPNMIFMDRDGNALAPGIIHLDRRSEAQGLRIADIIGLDRFTGVTGNIPCPGGMSVTSLLWTKEHRPDVYNKAYKFGHTNTFFLKRLVDRFVVDPANASFIGLYNTLEYSDWNLDFCHALGIDTGKLPEISFSWKVAGKLKKDMADLTGIPEGIPVVTGGGDTACAVYGSGCTEDGQLLNSTGTVEVMALCVANPFYDEKFVFRTSVIPRRWVSMNIIGAGGESLNWFYNTFCPEMDKDAFFTKYLPEALNTDFHGSEEFTPHLAGDRVCIGDKQAVLSGLNLGSTRPAILKALVDGMMNQLLRGMDTFRQRSNLSDLIYFTGGGSKSLMDYKKKVFSGFRFEEVHECAIRGIASLVRDALTGKWD